MAVKIYKPTDSFVALVDDPTKPEKTYTPAAHCEFGFDGTIVWVRDLLDNVYILKEDVTNVQNEAGTLTQTVSGVETYLLTFIGG